MISQKKMMVLYLAFLLFLTALYVRADIYPTGWTYQRNEETNSTVISHGMFYKETIEFDNNHTSEHAEITLALIGMKINKLRMVWQLNLFVIPFLLVGIIWMLSKGVKQTGGYGVCLLLLLLVIILFDLSFFTETSGEVHNELSNLIK
ncbi:hypothetical protein LCM10_12995 [Rossellomorea aquimaris]|uniref:hypothetical protein n=1 Tax=Rossellomorea aquimaris TaxID=189382 RepID=UPI001CD5CD40|nr:hypothetical protein [Rossellomorea aquimaris]MCA1055908.1 hypothetical protein [Rossellomorea aquimaris]